MSSSIGLPWFAVGIAVILALIATQRRFHREDEQKALSNSEEPPKGEVKPSRAASAILKFVVALLFGRDRR